MFKFWTKTPAPAPAPKPVAIRAVLRVHSHVSAGKDVVVDERFSDFGKVVYVGETEMKRLLGVQVDLQDNRIVVSFLRRAGGG